ncbi:PH domain-containing protein [Luteimonas sp. MJ293]|uniref:PH domain-containing protein n=1 Tax=Luteimonas sp. MJ146 TaxID=3129240 RepID=UPI0031BB7BC6
MIELDDLGLPGLADAAQGPEEADWQPLPARARPLFMLSGALGWGIPTLIALAIAGTALVATGRPTLVAAAALLWIILVAMGAWMGLRRFRYTWWLLDEDGFALRRGRMWRSETRVPASRVQHLDIRRGPLERRFRLSTLLVHTAGTRQHAVAVPGLDEDDAERLRDHLARQVENDDDDA